MVITGMGALSPFGEGVSVLWSSLLAGRCGLAPLPDSDAIDGLGAATAGLVPEIDIKSIPRIHRRSMSRMTVYAYMAAREALNAYPEYPAAMGLAIGDTLGSPGAISEFFTEYLVQRSLKTIRSTTFFKTMGHGVTSSLAIALGLTGRALAPSAACAAGLMAIGLGYEAIAAGSETAMLCGGSEEFHILTAATFDHILAASHNPDPATASRPFDSRRDGLVCSEGAGILLLESLESALRRNAPIWAEIVGFATNSSPKSPVNPDPASIRDCMARVLDEAGIRPGEVSAVSAHATATVDGDRAEAGALARLFGNSVPVGSLKGQLGHTMAASGPLELIAGLNMMREGVFLPNHNLETIDPECGGVMLPTRPIKTPVDILLKNSFALGGVNASMLVKRYVPGKG